MNVGISCFPRSDSDCVVTLTQHGDKKPSAASLFHHILHINKTARRWNEEEGLWGRGRGSIRQREKKKTKEKEIQIDRVLLRSVIVTLLGWMNVSDGHCRFRQEGGWNQEKLVCPLPLSPGRGFTVWGAGKGWADDLCRAKSRTIKFAVCVKLLKTVSVSCSQPMTATVKSF